MAAWCNGHFDEKIFHAFVKTVGIYPNGLLLKLKSGRLGVVVEQSKKLTTPFVKDFSLLVRMHIFQRLSQSKKTIASIKDPLQWGIDLDKVQGI